MTKELEHQPKSTVDVVHMADFKKRPWHRKGRRGNVARFGLVDGRWQSFAIPSSKIIETAMSNGATIVTGGSALVVAIIAKAIEDAVRDGWEFPDAVIKPKTREVSRIGFPLEPMDPLKLKNYIGGEELPPGTGWHDFLAKLPAFVNPWTLVESNSEDLDPTEENVLSDETAAMLPGLSGVGERLPTVRTPDEVDPIVEQWGKLYRKIGAEVLSMKPTDKNYLFWYRVSDLNINPLKVSPDGRVFFGAQYSDGRYYNVDEPQGPETLFDLHCPCGVHIDRIRLEEISIVLDAWHRQNPGEVLPLPILDRAVRQLRGTQGDRETQR